VVTKLVRFACVIKRCFAVDLLSKASVFKSCENRNVVWQNKQFNNNSIGSAPLALYYLACTNQAVLTQEANIKVPFEVGIWKMPDTYLLRPRLHCVSATYHGVFYLQPYLCQVAELTATLVTGKLRLRV